MDNVPLNNLNKQFILSAVRKMGCRFRRTETKGMYGDARDRFEAQREETPVLLTAG